MARATLDIVRISFTSNTGWLEECDDRRAESPEELLTRLEGMLEQGECDINEVLNYLTDLNYKEKSK